MGSILHSHGIHFFVLSAPDFLLGPETDPAERNVVGLLKRMPDVARKALSLRSVGQRVTEVIGGRGTHPVSCVAGGLAAPLTPDRLASLKKLAEEGRELAIELVEFSRKALTERRELMQLLPLPTHYLGTVKDGALDLYDGKLRLRSPEGKDLEFSEDDWMSYLFEETLPSSYAKPVFCKTEAGPPVPFRVGALARLNCADRIDTPLAQAELERFRELYGKICHETVLYHYARLIEILHAAEKLSVIASDPEILSPDVRSVPTHGPKSATAHVEAPRGVLIHDYQVNEKGIVERANLIVATQQNIHALNETIGLAAEKLVTQSDEALLNGIEFGIRCYDPCLSCATHRAGEMKLDVTVRRGGAVIRRARR
ncbi:MAG: nickel-dependent hydrogenase large subunit [Acidobacteria bacterium]|nr:nickel-dependent hydrogenase large subunit [Acidobacteriota bacterium]